MFKGIRALISKTCKEVDIPSYILYGIVVTNSEREAYSTVSVKYDTLDDTLKVGLTKLSIDAANIMFTAHRDNIEKSFPYLRGSRYPRFADLFDPYLNLYLAALHLKTLYNTYQSWETAIHIFNAGVDNIELANMDDYVDRVLKNSKKWFLAT